MINRAIIIGSGFSVRENLWNTQIEKLPVWSAIKNEFTIGMNWSQKWFNSTVLMYSDYQWYTTQKDELKLDNVPLILGKVDGYYNRKDSESIGNNVILLKECECSQRLKYNENKPGMHPTYWGKDAWSKGFYTSQLIGLKAINLAVAMGCNEIYLLGMDACSDEQDRTHFYSDTEVGKYKWQNHEQNGVGKHKNGNYRTGNYNKIEELNGFWFQPFEQEIYNGVKIYNVSTESKINTFIKITYECFYERLKQNVNHEEIRQSIKDKLKCL